MTLFSYYYKETMFLCDMRVMYIMLNYISIKQNATQGNRTDDAIKNSANLAQAPLKS